MTNLLASTTLTGRLTLHSLFKGIILIGTGVLAYSAAVQAFAFSVRLNNPELARQIAPSNSLALIASAENLIFAGKQDPAFPLVSDLSRRSLSIDPINPAALRNLGFAAEKLGTGGKAEVLMNLSAATSRRDFLAQLWLIEAATNNEDLKAALLHHDTALRTFPESETTLFPILTAALEDDAIRQELALRIKKQPSWLNSFLNHTIALSLAPEAVADLLIQARLRADDEAQKDIERRLLYALAAKENWASAARYVKWISKSNDALFSNSNFNQATTNQWLWPFTWEPTSAPGVSVSFEDENRVARISADSGQRLMVLRRFTYLRPGAYRLNIIEQSVLDSRGAEHAWDVNCLRKSVPSSAIWTSGAIRLSRLATINDAFNIPSKCDAIGIQLSVVGGLGQQGVEFLVKNLTIEPVKAAAAAAGAQ